MDTTPSPNFAYLAHHDARLVALATQAEEHFSGDPTVSLFKLRQFGEVLAQRAAAKVGLFVSTEEGQQQLIDRLWDRKASGVHWAEVTLERHRFKMRFASFADVIGGTNKS